MSRAGEATRYSTLALGMICVALGWVLGSRSSSSEPPSPPTYLQQLKGALDLRPDQVAAIDRVLAEETAELRELVASHRDAMREPVAARRQLTEDEILALLDPDQRVTYEQRTAH